MALLHLHLLSAPNAWRSVATPQPEDVPADIAGPHRYWLIFLAVGNDAARPVIPGERDESVGDPRQLTTASVDNREG